VVDSPKPSERPVIGRVGRGSPLPPPRPTLGRSGRVLAHRHVRAVGGAVVGCV